MEDTLKIAGSPVDQPAQITPPVQNLGSPSSDQKHETDFRNVISGTRTKVFLDRPLSLRCFL